MAGSLILILVGFFLAMEVFKAQVSCKATTDTRIAGIPQCSVPILLGIAAYLDGSVAMLLKLLQQLRLQLLLPMP
jgi:hypothetical protein